MFILLTTNFFESLTPWFCFIVVRMFFTYIRSIQIKCIIAAGGSTVAKFCLLSNYLFQRTYVPEINLYDHKKKMSFK